MAIRKLLASGLLVGMGVVACGGSDDSSNSGTAVAVKDVPKLAADAYCKLYERCLGPLFSLFLNGEDCRTLTERRFQNSELGTLQDAIDAGSVKYRADKVSACLSEISGRSCDELTQRGFDACEQALEGTVASGGDCKADYECQGKDSFCEFSAACPGKCAARKAAGESCTADDDCTNGLMCADDGTCTKPVGLGAACGQGVAPDCEPRYACLGGDATTQTAGTCTDPATVLSGKEGDTCDIQATDLCDAGLTCAATSAGPPAGVECVAKVASGATCKHFAFPDQCPAGEYCDAAATDLEGTCKALPKAGEPCVQGLTSKLCEPYARCDSTGTCRPLADDGAACEGNALCYSEHCIGGKCTQEGGC